MANYYDDEVERGRSSKEDSVFCFQCGSEILRVIDECECDLCGEIFCAECFESDQGMCVNCFDQSMSDIEDKDDRYGEN